MKTLKLALLGATFLAGASALSAANAADVYSRGGSLKDSGPVDYAPAISWTGFYIGARLGSTFDDTITLHDSFDNELELEADDELIGGIHLGYNWQRSGHLVLGIEGNVDFGGTDLDYLASVRGRLGVTSGATLFYGTAGIAFLGDDTGALEDDTLVGWAAGLGIEHKIKPNLSIGLEGLYYAFDDNEIAGVSGIEADRDFVTIQARLTYHFGDRHADPLK